MSIFINPLCEVELFNSDDDDEGTLVGSCNINELARQLGHQPTRSDIDQWFERATRRALTDERDWRLYKRYMEVAAMFGPDDSLIRAVATNLPSRTPEGPRVWLTRYVYTDPGAPVPDVPEPWGAAFVQTYDDPPTQTSSGERWDEWDVGLDVTYMDSGEIFRHAYALEEWVAANPWTPEADK